MIVTKSLSFQTLKTLPFREYGITLGACSKRERDGKDERGAKMNKPANAKRTEAFKAINDTFTRIVESYPTTKDIPRSSGESLATMIEGMANLSKAPRWSNACISWAEFIRENLAEMPQITHWAYCQGCIYFCSDTNGLLNYPEYPED